MRLLPECGMMSDDTEHTIFVAQSLLSSDRNAELFQRALGWKLAGWILSLPAGVGLATARACLKLVLGFPASRTAVKSGGAGAAMRSAIIGAYFPNEPERRKIFVRAATAVTHRGWQAELGAEVVAECAAQGANEGRANVESVLAILRRYDDEREWRSMVDSFEKNILAGAEVSQFAAELGLQKGVTGYALHIAIVAIYAWARHGEDFRRALSAVLDCGGDTDTVGAVTGALCGASLGREAIPKEWLKDFHDWPRSAGLLEKIARQLAEQKRNGELKGPVKYFWPGVFLRNPFFLVVVLTHGFRRLLPPY